MKGLVVASLVVAGSVVVGAQVSVPPPPPQADAGSASARPQTVFRTGVDLVALNVIVTDPAQNYVNDLLQADFEVYEDGVQQDLSFFASSSLPLDLALLLDTSASMTSRMDTVQRAAIGFLRTLRPEDRATVLTVSGTVRVLEGLTNDRDSLERAVKGTSAKGSTALYNGLYIALKDFGKQRRAETELRRRAIVLLSDGQDTASLIGFDEVLKLAQQSGVSIYPIALSAPYSQPRGKRRYFSQSDHSMRVLAEETGAQSFFPEKIDELTGVYDRIAVELANQYSLGYTSKNPKRDGAFRRLVVRILSKPGLRSRARLGYIANLIRLGDH